MEKRMICLMTALFLLASLMSPVYAAGDTEYETLTRRWVDRLTGGDYTQTGEVYETYIRQKVKAVSDNGQKLAKQLTSIPSQNRDYLWGDLIMGDTNDEEHRNARQMSQTLERIETMALAYRTRGADTSGLREKIIGALNFMVQYKYNENTPRTNRNLSPANPSENWYEWEIRAPKALTNIMLLMKDELDPGLMEGLRKGIRKQLPSIGMASTGGNRLNMSLYYILGGIATEDAAWVQEGIEALDVELEWHVVDDGFYEDGSFIQHHNYPYNGGYGSSGLSSIADILYLLEGSSFMAENPNLSRIYQWVYQSFEPWLYEGRFMDPVRGRGISRKSDTGYGFLEPLVVLSQTAPQEHRTCFQSMIKRMGENRANVNPFKTMSSIYTLECLYRILSDNGVTAQTDRTQYKNYGAMDRSVTHRPGYAFAVSMYSDRIRNFESINGENLKGWFTASGATYLYNDDLNQYLEDYWPTVDKQRFAGTTVVKNSSEENAAFGDAFAGGVEMDGLYGVNAMQYRAPKTKDGAAGGLEAKKAWFVLDDSIVCLGADISGTAGDTETIVDNRKVDNLVSRLAVNGTRIGGEETRNFQNPSWAHLKGSAPDTVRTHSTDIGYYFPLGGALTAKQEKRTDTWKSISENGDTGACTKDFVSLAFQHGARPKGASYAYALLPGKTQSETEAFAKAPDFTILSNTRELQAVRKNSDGMTGAVFWQTGQKLDGVTSHQPALMMKKQEGDTLYLSFSDPAQTEAVLRFTLEGSWTGVLAADNGVSVFPGVGTTEITINSTEALGKSLKLTLQKQAVTGAPSVPQSLSVEAKAPTAAQVTWRPSAEAERYHLVCSTSREGTYVPVPVLEEETAYLDRRLEPGGTYYYRLAAENQKGVSGYSEPTAVTLPAAESAETAPEIRENFEAYARPSPLAGQNGWTVKLGKAFRSRAEVIASEDGQQLWLDAPMRRDKSDAQAEISKQLTPMRDMVTAELDFQVPDTGWKNLVILNSGNTVAVQVYANDGGLWTYDGPNWDNKGRFREQNIEPGQSYHLRVILNVKTNDLWVFVDGKLLEFDTGEGYISTIPTRSPVQQIDSFRIGITGQVGGLYADNLLVTGNALELLDEQGNPLDTLPESGERCTVRMRYLNRSDSTQKMRGFFALRDGSGTVRAVHSGDASAAPGLPAVWDDTLVIPEGFDAAGAVLTAYFWEDETNLRPLAPAMELRFAQ